MGRQPELSLEGSEESFPGARFGRSFARRLGRGFLARRGQNPDESFDETGEPLFVPLEEGEPPLLQRGLARQSLQHHGPLAVFLFQGKLVLLRFPLDVRDCFLPRLTFFGHRLIARERDLQGAQAFRARLGQHPIVIEQAG